MSDDNVTWVPVIDSRGFDRDQDGNVYAYCRAVPVPWSQEPPMPPAYAPEWAWFVGTIYPDDTPGVFHHYDEPIALFVALGEVYWSIKDYHNCEPACSVSDCQGEWLPATVPQPPSIGEVTP